ncbi:MAG: glycoside hydrolase [Parasphingorhabdus sp.]|uniref:glycoside hydrolase n=1 Tax=Parasphingorhabdus sp. TaxID=2709688 RepID=UPI00300101F8
MTPTVIGLGVFILGIWLLYKGDILVLLCAMLLLGLLEGSAAVVLPAIGGSSIPPDRIMLGFLAVASLNLIKDRSELGKDAIVENCWLVLFCAYGFISAFFLPRIFQGQIDVVPLRPAGLRSLFDVFPLAFSSQNITTAVYLIGTGLAAIFSYVAVRRASDVTPLVTIAIVTTLSHAALGVLEAVLRGTPWDMVVDFFRNGSYAQLSQQTSSFIRISGFMAEPSNFADFGIVWMIFVFELWLRNIKPFWTGIAASVMALTLILSTSSTAYLGIAGYAAVLLARFATFPKYLRTDKMLLLVGAALAVVVLLMSAIIFSSEFAKEFQSMILEMTLEKTDSDSGQQRSFWALQGLEAFKISYGLGIGAGSFRSSSIATAILGGMGVIGIICFGGYLLKLFQTAHVSGDIEGSGSVQSALTSAACWSAIAGLIPALFTQASPDPGMQFSILAGIAIALKHQLIANRGQSQPVIIANRPVTVDQAKAPTNTPPSGWRHVSK